MADRRDDRRGKPGAAIDELTALGAAISDNAVRERATMVGADDLATLIYTSGTTGRPKGCEITHRNLLAVTRAAVSEFTRLMQPANSLLLFLPLAHVFARIIQCCCVYARITLGHTPDVKNLVAELAEFRPTFVLAVPRVFEKVYNSAEQKAHADGKGTHLRLRRRHRRRMAAGPRTPAAAGRCCALKHAVFDQLVYAKLRAALGGHVQSRRLRRRPARRPARALLPRHRRAGLEGYGLTETSAPATVNRPRRVKIGTVGQPLPGVTVRIADDGEVLVKGADVFRGYWHNDQATAGGAQSTAGSTPATSASSTTTASSGSPAARRRSSSPPAARTSPRPCWRTASGPTALVSQCMVVGDQQPFIAALVTLDAEALPAWRAERGKPAGSSAADLIDDPDLRAEIQRAVDDANKAVSRAEAIRKFGILPGDFTEAGGQLTPSLKVKRVVVAKDSPPRSRRSTPRECVTVC